MKELHFKVNFNGKVHSIYIERHLLLYFNSKTEAKNYVRRYKKTVHDNILMLGNISQQLYTLKHMFYQNMDFRSMYNFNDYHMSFEKSFFQIYHNRGGDDSSVVQFNQIRISFDRCEDMILVLKRHGRRKRQVMLLRQLTAIEKLFNLIYSNYDSEIKHLFVAKGLKGRVIKLDNNANKIPYSQSLRQNKTK